MELSNPKKTENEALTGVIAGIDISPENTFISYYTSEMDGPETISTVMGSESYQIPTVLAKRKGLGQWFFGNDAVSQVRLSIATEAVDFYEKALAGERVFLENDEFDARDLLCVFMRKLISLPIPGLQKKELSMLVICTENLDIRVYETMNAVCQRLSIEPDKLCLIDRTESFYYYSLSQKRDMYLHDVLLFDYNGGRLKHSLLKRNRETSPETVTIENTADGELLDRKDAEFDRILEDLFSETTVSTVFLIGSGFDGDWMKTSLNRLLTGRRVFLGKNLYSKGACYAGIVKSKLVEWPFVYIGDNELKVNLSLKVLDQNEMKFITLLTAGDNWYEARGECEVILDGDPTIECWVQRPDERKGSVTEISLNSFPKRENRTSRLRIEAAPVSDSEVKLTVRDLGFGEISPQTKKSWEQRISG